MDNTSLLLPLVGSEAATASISKNLLGEDKNDSIPLVGLLPSTALSSQSTQYRKARSKKSQYGHTLKRHYLHGLVGIITPFIITVYYSVIWLRYIKHGTTGTPVAFGPTGASFVFYSWFAIGVIGLSLSNFALAGIEASMMMNPYWAVPTAAHVVMHSEKDWSGPSGWLRTAKKISMDWRKPATLWPSRLWWILAGPSISIFIALPLSGLAMTLGSGYSTGTSHPEVTGFNHDNFNYRYQISTRAYNNWNVNTPAQVPGIGTIYTPPEFDRSLLNSSFMAEVPSALPQSDGVPEIFLAPQGTSPINGSSFGLALRYNCSVVGDLSGFSILNHRKNASGFRDGYQYTTFENDTIFIRNVTIGNVAGTNVYAAAEVGSPPVWDYSIPYDANDPFPRNGYYNARPNLTTDYPGLDHEDVLEIAIWQKLATDIAAANPPPTSSFNLTLDTPIPQLEGAYKTVLYSSPEAPLSAVGVRCTSSSAVGTANIDGQYSTFTNFKRSDTPFLPNPALGAPRLNSATMVGILPFMKLGYDKDWLTPLYDSTSGPQPVDLSFASSGFDEGSTLQIRISMLQADDLRKALLRLYAAITVQLIYNGGQGFSNITGVHDGKFINTNATAFEPSIIMLQGIISPWIPGIILILWAVIIWLLTILYGFRRRWAKRLDGYTMFMFGADKAELVRHQPGQGLLADFESSAPLRNIPGLIGDEQPGFWPGHISLVKGNVASKSKKYM